MKPLVGITGNYILDEGLYCLRDYYATSIYEAGGIPLIVPPLENQEAVNEYLAVCNGWIFSGGGDMDPSYWGNLPIWANGEINPPRDKFEFDLAQRLLAGTKPVLGICRGAQVINVAAGGTLIQDMDTRLCHIQKAPRNYPFHDIFIEKGSRLEQIVKCSQMRVNSFHHQAVDKPGRGIRISARAVDGTIEAIESMRHGFLLGVQWHPECLTDDHTSRLFKAFVDACYRSCH